MPVSLIARSLSIVGLISMAILLCFLEVISAANVLMQQWLWCGPRIEVRLPIQPALQYRLYCFVRAGLELQGSGTGRFQPLSISVSQPDQAQTGSVALLRIPARFHNSVGDSLGSRPRCGSPVEYSRRRPAQIPLMRFRAVFPHRGSRSRLIASRMAGYSNPSVKHFHSCRTVSKLDLLPDQ